MLGNDNVDVEMPSLVELLLSPLVTSSMTLATGSLATPVSFRFGVTLGVGEMRIICEDEEGGVEGSTCIRHQRVSFAGKFLFAEDSVMDRLLG